MGYAKSAKILDRMKLYLDEMLMSKSTQWEFANTSEANTFAYALRNALYFVRVNNTQPYAAYAFTVKQDKSKIVIKRAKAWAIVRRGDENTKSDNAVYTLSELILLFNQDLNYSQYTFPNLVIQPDEEEMFDFFLTSKDLVLTQKSPIMLKNASTYNLSRP
jgi:hypothetical protein